jgi:hypothetical protein
MTEQALRECARCGKSASVSSCMAFNKDGRQQMFKVLCEGNCHQPSPTEEEAIAAWNTRAYDTEREELMRVKREYEKLKATLHEAKILAALVSEYDLLDTSPLNYESLGIELSDRVSRAWNALELLRNY